MAGRRRAGKGKPQVVYKNPTGSRTARRAEDKAKGKPTGIESASNTRGILPSRRSRRGATIVTTPVTRPTRADSARERAQKRRRLSTGAIVGIVTVTVAIIVLVTYVATNKAKPAKTGPLVRTQRTLLFQVQAADRTAELGALFAADPRANTAAAIFIPGQLLLGVPSLGVQTFTQTLQADGASASKRGLANLLGVTIDNTWTIDAKNLAAIIDGVAPTGLQLDVDADVLTPQPGGGARIEIRAGPQRLKGVRAIQYASYIASDETELDAFPRFQRVLDALLQALPSAEVLAGKLGSLGPDLHSTAKAADLAALLVNMHAARAAGSDQVAFDVLPTLTNDTGGPVTYRVDESLAHNVITEDLGASIPTNRPPAGHRVLLYNGRGGVQVTKRATDRLLPAGFLIVDTKNAKSFSYATSLILVKDGTDASLALGRRVATLLHVPATDVRVSTLNQTVADVIVVLGHDYTP